MHRGNDASIISICDDVKNSEHSYGRHTWKRVQNMLRCVCFLLYGETTMLYASKAYRLLNKPSFTIAVILKKIKYFKIAAADRECKKTNAFSSRQHPKNTALLSNKTGLIKSSASSRNLTLLAPIIVIISISLWENTFCEWFLPFCAIRG